MCLAICFILQKAKQGLPNLCLLYNSAFKLFADKGFATKISFTQFGVLRTLVFTRFEAAFIF